ncbi:hypothetical protein [Leptolyngbya sp. BC1307]|uniref:hypothetical protein n=1 Tax=Leptolyngbya sp. BC1307 TaxID=2029589 RepID=UPI000EFB3BD7|nr:hypothetical protein [Leptolyngbya sp. BC1307]
MIVSSIREFCPESREWQSVWEQFEQAERFPALVRSALQLGLLFARWVLSTAPASFSILMILAFNCD